MEMGKHSRWANLLHMAAIIMAIGWAASNSWAAEAKYPNRLIQVVVPYQPGFTDVVLRLFTDKWQESLGQPLAFVYKPGAAGAVGASFVAKAKPDGYTLVGSTNAPVLLSPITKELDYTPDDFAPICRLTKTPVMFTVKADSPWKTLKDLVEEAKKNPGKVTYATSGIFGTSHFPVEMFVKFAKINMTHVPCAGDTPAVTALLGGGVNMVSCTVTAVVPHIKSGALRPIGVFAKERLKEFPDVPTFSELGYPVVQYVWVGLLAPKGVPEEVVKTIHTTCKKIVENQKSVIEDRLEKMSLLLDVLGPQEFANELKAEGATMKGIFNDLKKSIKQ
jgi:tripartite-type tricarboxylate transporter receptor subunit TctC